MTISALSDLGLAQRDTRSQKANLGQEDFLKLMTTQLTHQDPFKPMESGEFLGQIASSPPSPASNRSTTASPDSLVHSLRLRPCRPAAWLGTACWCLRARLICKTAIQSKVR